MADLSGKVGLVVGIANSHSIAAGCAKAYKAAGAELAVTYLNDKAKPFVEPVAGELASPLFAPYDYLDPATADRLFDGIREKWGRLDFLLHSVAYCPMEDLHAPLIECSGKGFAEAMQISCHSFIDLARRAVPLMENGGALTTVTYHGADEVFPHYNVMGPVKAALESSVRTLAADLGPKGIRVNALSTGPVPTRAASGLEDFKETLEDAQSRAPIRRLVTLEEIGGFAAFLASDPAAAVTGGVHYIDGGLNIIA